MPGLMLAMLLAAPPVPPPEPVYAPRGNTILDPTRRRPSFGVGASARFGVLVGSGDVAVQPFGFGFAFQFRAHFLRVARARLGIAFHGGHTRFPERKTFRFEDELGEQRERVRWKVLAHTDLSLGPSVEVPVGPVLILGSVTPGFGISSFYEPLSEHDTDEYELTGYDFMLRGGAAIGVPIRNNQGLLIGVGVQQYFTASRYPIYAADALPDDPPVEEVAIFDTVLENYLTYQVWF